MIGKARRRKSPVLNHSPPCQIGGLGMHAPPAGSHDSHHANLREASCRYRALTLAWNPGVRARRSTLRRHNEAPGATDATRR